MTASELNLACRAIVDGRRAARALACWMRQFELSEPEFLVLWCLRGTASAGLDQSTIAENLALSPAQVSATVERLRIRGCIAREEVSGDRRRHLWRLSASGCALLATIYFDAEGPAGQEAAA